MLELLVLGQIPGTQIHITFAWFLIAALSSVGYAVHRIKNQQLQ